MGLLDKLLGGNVLFYPGCMEKFVLREQEKNYEEILKKIGIDFIKLKDLEVCCGSPVLNAGYLEDFKTLAKKNFKVFKEHGVKRIITPCPACFKTFKLEYPKVIEDFDIEVEHMTQTLLKALKEGKLKPKRLKKVKVTYHDPCHLGRYCGVYEEPREIIKFLGLNLIEMEFNRENAFCCGGGGGLRSNYPELAREIAKERMKQALKTKAKILVTCCPLCYACLKEVGRKIEVKELSELFV